LKILQLTLTVLLLATTAACAGGLNVVADGRSEFSIVVAQDAIPAERFAAEELAWHIREMSGADLKIISDTNPLPENAILLGHTRHLAELGVTPEWAQLGKEGYLIRVLESYLIIAGGRPRGTLYGVYDLLQEHWGCRWFTFDTSHIPKKPTLTVPALDAVNRPVFEFRNMTIVDMGGAGGGWFAQHLDEKYMARARRNFGHDSEKLARYGGCFKILPNLGHNYLWVVDPGKYGADHPEYYALEGGKRLNYDLSINQVELCLSNAGTVQAAAETITAWLRRDPDVDMIFIGQSDTRSYCKCDNCNAVRKKHGGWDSARRVQIPANLPEDYWNEFGGFAGLQIEFLNRVAEALEKEFPNTPIGTYAYWHTRQPPQGIKAHRNVVVWYCPWNLFYDPQVVRCYCHSVDSGPVNDDFVNFGAELGAWTRIANHVYVYDYWLGCWFAQPVNIPTLRRTMRFYRKLGVQGMWLDGSRGVPAGFEWLTLWLWFQLAWNPDFDVDQGIDEFCSAYYGAAAPYVKQYIEMACRPQSYAMASRPDTYQPDIDRTKVFTEDPHRPIKYDKLRDCQLIERVMTTAAIGRGYELFQKARKAVANDPKALKHVEYTRMALQYAMLEWLPGTDPRLEDETELLVQLAKELEFAFIGRNAIKRDEYRDAIRKKIELGAPLYPPKQTTDRQSAFGATPPEKAHYMDGTDYRDLVPKLGSIANLPAGGWLFKDDPEGVGVARGYDSPNHPTADFAEIQIGDFWDRQGHKDLKHGWYRLRYKCPEFPEGKRVFLHFEAVDESAWLYVDGKLVAWYDTAYPDMTWDKPFLLEVTGSLKSGAEHLLAIRVGNTIGYGGIYRPVSLMVEK